MVERSMLLYKYRALTHLRFTLDILLNQRLYCSFYDQLNDPFEGVFYTITEAPLSVGTIEKGAQRKTENSIKDLQYYDALDQYRICSLSKSLHDVRMWSHYANALTGLAIEIELPKDFNGLYKVKYKESLPSFNSDLLEGPEPSTVLVHKTRHWKYEKEYRIIRSTDYLDIAGLIRGVYFGPRMSAIDRDLIQKAIDGRYPIFETSVNFNDLRIEPMRAAGRRND